jgi:acyl-CoA reductase-like NAD-dependent aldehyde dehydrogenase
LFQSSLGGPRWERLPWEVRQQTVRLLARMLNEHAERQLASLLTQEAGDE